MILNDVKHLSSPERFGYWITEREKIRQARLVGKPAPWTDDEILQSYRFCNVRRIEDRVSNWLLVNWYKPNFDHPNALLACTVARQLNNTDALQAIGYPDTWRPAMVQEILETRAKSGLKNYSAAYMITGGYGAKGRAKQTKPYQTVWIVCNRVYEELHSARIVVQSSRMKTMWGRLLGLPGFSSFIAGQVVADLRWTIRGLWQDRNVWAPMGPGSVRGLNRYFGRNANAPMLAGKFEEEFSMVLERHRNILPRLEAIDIQSCLCEFDKYCRVLNCEGRPKQLYNGREI